MWCSSLGNMNIHFLCKNICWGCSVWQAVLDTQQCFLYEPNSQNLVSKFVLLLLCFVTENPSFSPFQDFNWIFTWWMNMFWVGLVALIEGRGVWKHIAVDLLYVRKGGGAEGGRGVWKSCASQHCRWYCSTLPDSWYPHFTFLLVLSFLPDRCKLSGRTIRCWLWPLNPNGRRRREKLNAMSSCTCATASN